MCDQNTSEFSDKHIKQCITAGCTSAYLNKDGWLIGDMPGGKGEVIIRRRDEALNAWVVIDRNPKAITREVKDGFAPQRIFRSINEVCLMAIKNPYY